MLAVPSPNRRTGGMAPETQAQVRAILEGLAVASKYPARRWAGDGQGRWGGRVGTLLGRAATGTCTWAGLRAGTEHG